MSSTQKNILALIVCLILPQVAGGLGAIATADSVSTWYTEINKPGFTPPGWVFPVVWPTLYFMMGLASWFVWKERVKDDGSRVKKALIVYGIHLVLNTLWSFLFFGMQNPGAAFIEIIILLAMIAWTIKLFYDIRPLAGYLLIPYIIWVSYATVLTGTIWWIN